MTSRPVPDEGAIRFETPRAAFGIVAATLALVRARLGPLVRAYLAIGAPVALAGGVATTLFVRAAAPLLDPSLEVDPADVGSDVSTTYAGAMLLTFLATATVLALGAAFVRRYREGAPPEALTVGLLWDETRGLLIPALAMVMVVGGVAMLSSVVAGVAGAGALLWLTALLWAMPYVAIAFAVRMLEGGTLAESFARARRLVRGRWGRTGGGLLLAMLVGGALSVGLSLPLLMVGAGGAAAPPATPVEAVEVLGWMLGPMQVLTSGAYLVPVLAAFVAHGALVAEAEPGPAADEDDVPSD